MRWELTLVSETPLTLFGQNLTLDDHSGPHDNGFETAIFCGQLSWGARGVSKLRLKQRVHAEQVVPESDLTEECPFGVFHAVVDP